MKATVALWKEPGGPASLEPVEIGALAAREVLVRMSGGGICRTDLAAAAGIVPLPVPFVLGHEGAGVVEAVGAAVDTVEVGDEVILSFDSCGDCVQCAANHPAFCELFPALNYSGTRLDGSTTLTQDDLPVHGSWLGQSSFGTYAVAGVRNTVKVPTRPAGLPLEFLGPLGCGVLAGAGTVFNVLRPQPGQGIAVFGLGGVGLSAVMAATVAGCHPIIGIDPHPRRRPLAQEVGATHTIDPGGVDDIDRAIAHIAGAGVDFAVDTVGSGAVVRHALMSLRMPGVCATLGLQAMKNDITIDQGHLQMGRTLTGGLEGDADPHTLIPHLIDLWRQGRFPFDQLITRFPFPRIEDALEAVRSGKAVKPVLVFD
ncbi:NAD(P)-dependent alcohol dehydrogenase [Streptomyces iconiensis]|uniref:NAD(P)-dependent alcohol dehydrogenase n=1 Tax=Streptomyces iconiensis TaxID=1384038 RepID=A0ABT7A259_9ACTN|nr:NAD(P)-dependent alcohol dehydrogenase [Streptomyces iconiensis]MDJ1135144.1 NAD(P)-dependent alcohol dehydrogenase [Streptomyces iconiensis]